MDRASRRTECGACPRAMPWPDIPIQLVMGPTLAAVPPATVRCERAQIEVPEVRAPNHGYRATNGDLKHR